MTWFKNITNGHPRILVALLIILLVEQKNGHKKFNY
ncbi:hypothetical protein K710_0812 [Streptococcus iniae SF1]|nr:hypothetical protein K710_0812 [Streptococcus iniae SF1]